MIGTISTMDAIKSLVPDAEVSVSTTGNPDDGEIIAWAKPAVAPVTSEEIETEKARLLTEWTANEYARSRKEEYDALNQLEMQFDDKEDGTTTWEDAINAIKTKYPKG